MKFTETIERWFGYSSEEKDSGAETTRHMDAGRMRNICNELGEDVDPEALDMLAQRGLSDTAIAELIQAVNMLNCRMVGILDLEINKMYAEGVLGKYGYLDIEQYNDELRGFSQKSYIQH